MWRTIQSNNNKNRSSKYQAKIHSKYKQKLNINSLFAVCGQFKTTTTKTDQVSIKPKYYSNYKQKRNINSLPDVDNSNQQQQKQVK